MEQQRTKNVARTALLIIDNHGPISNKLLYSRIENEHSDLGGRAYSDALTQLQELDLVRSFDGGRDTMFEITRQGVCALADDN